MRELYPVVEQLVAEARAAGIGVTLDAEEAERLELSLLLVDKLLASEITRGYAGFGLAVQAYQKRAYSTIEWLIGRAQGAPTGASHCGWSRAPTGTARSSARRSAGSRATRYSRASRTPTCRTWPAPGSSSAPASASIRSSPPTTRTPSRTSRRSLAATPIASSSSVCTAWAQSSTTASCAGPWGKFPCRVYAPVGAHEDLLAVPGAPAARERRQYLVRQSHRRCEPAGRGSHRRSDRGSRCARARGASAYSDCRRTCSHPSASIQPDSISPMARRVDALLRDCERASQQPWSAAPVISGQTRSGASRAGAQSRQHG